MRGGDNREPPLEVSIDDGSNNNSNNSNNSNKSKKKEGDRRQDEEGEVESQGKATVAGTEGRARQDSSSSSAKTAQAVGH